MNCAEFQERLFVWLEDRLEAAEVERLKAHAAGCLRCKELETLATGDARLPAIEPPDDMVASIMAQTTGGACDRALLLVSERLDLAAVRDVSTESRVGAPSGVGAPSAAEPDPLLEMHLESCAECARVAGALERLQRELPAMAEMQPDPGFVGDVLAATVGAAAAEGAAGPAGVVAAAGVAAPGLHLVSRPSFDWREWVQGLPLAARVSTFFERLGQRPRLAFEGAFVGSLALMLVIGMPSAGVAELPSRLMAEVRLARLEVPSGVTENFERVAEVGRAAWSASTDRLGERWGEYIDIRPDRAALRSQLADIFGSWRQASIEIATDLWEGEFSAAIARIWRLWTAPWRGDGTEEGSPGVGNGEGFPGSVAEYQNNQRHQS